MMMMLQLNYEEIVNSALSKRGKDLHYLPHFFRHLWPVTVRISADKREKLRKSASPLS